MDRDELVARGAQNGLWDWDLTTSRFHYSPAWIALLGGVDGDCGTTPDEWFKRIHPEDYEETRRAIESKLQNGADQFEVRHRMRHRDGCYHWMSCQGVISRDEKGKAVRVTGFHVDVTANVAVDALTGLPNRDLLLDRLERSIEKTFEHPDFLYAVLVVDLDLFESGVNRLETLNCDALIVDAARRLESALRTKETSFRERQLDLVARVANDQFVVLLEGLRELGEAQKVAERLMKVLLNPFALGGRDVTLSPSIGIVLSATGYRCAEDVLRDADAALCRAKSLGRCRCEVFDTALIKKAREREQLQKDLYGALSRDELMVFYQPIVSLASCKVEGLEALVRWKHPERGLIPPSTFLPLAEKTGQMVSIDRWVLRQVCRQLKAWEERPGTAGDFWVSVNLSGDRFSDASLVREVGEVLRDTGADPKRLVLELTEGTAMDKPEKVRGLLMQLRLLGCRLAMDDFGTGYSSLAHLRRFPLDYLKVDHSFVQGIDKRPDAREILRTILSLGHQLGLRVIVEGVESSEQLEWVRSLGCESVQGFLFSKPVDSTRVQGFLDAGFTFGSHGNPEERSAPGSVEMGAKKRFVHPRLRIAGAMIFLLVLLAAGAYVGWDRNDTPSKRSDVSSQPLTVSPQKAAEVSPASVAQTPPKEELRKTALTVTRTSKARAPEEFSFRVKHSHRIGSCRGVMKITRDALVYVDEEGKHDFVFNRAQYSAALEGDQLTIRSGKKTFRFKSAEAENGAQNRTGTQQIFERLTRLQPDQLRSAP